MAYVNCLYIIFISLAIVYGLTGHSGPFEFKVLSSLVTVNKQFESRIDVIARVDLFENGTASLYVFANVKKDMGVLGIKMKTLTWNEELKKYVLAVNLSTKNLCEKTFTKAFMKFVPNLGQDCRIKPAIYNFTIPNVGEVVQAITNGHFFYGKYMMISEMRGAGYGMFLKTNYTVLIHPKS